MEDDAKLMLEAVNTIDKQNTIKGICGMKYMGNATLDKNKWSQPAAPPPPLFLGKERAGSW